MKRLNKILVPTDLSEHSRRALSYGCWLSAEHHAALLVVHVASECNAWEHYSDDPPLAAARGKSWPADRVLSEASLDLTRFLEPSMDDLKSAGSATKRVTLGAVATQIAAVAESEQVDLIVMSPRRHRGLRHLIFGSVTDTVTRISPCPVLAVAAPLPSRTWRGKFVPWFPPAPRRRVAAT